MNIFAIIKKDHDEARDLMEQITETEDAGERETMIEELKMAILSHAKSEEKTFYEAMKATGDEELVEEIPHFKKEHKEVEKMFAEISAMDADDQRWLVKFGQIKQALLHHMEEEEEEVFPEAKKEIPAQESKELGEEMEVLEEKVKEKLMAEAA